MAQRHVLSQGEQASTPGCRCRMGGYGAWLPPQLGQGRIRMEGHPGLAPFSMSVSHHRSTGKHRYYQDITEQNHRASQKHRI